MKFVFVITIMNKSKSVYKSELPNFHRKGSLDIKNFQGFNPQIFTIQAQSFINQNFFQTNTEFLHDKSNHFINNLRKLNQKKLKSERLSSDLKKISNRSATTFATPSLVESLPKKLNIKLNTSAQTRMIYKPDESKSRINESIDLKKIEILLEKSINLSLSGEDPSKTMDEAFSYYFMQRSPSKNNDSNAGLLSIMKATVEKSIQAVYKKSLENIELNDSIKELLLKKGEEVKDHLQEIEELQKTIQTQTLQIEMLQTKEKQLIQFLLAIKARGIVDLEEIFNEEFNPTSSNITVPQLNKKIPSSQEKISNKSKNIVYFPKGFHEMSQEADISRVNDSEESSFNYYGKSEVSSMLMMSTPKNHDISNFGKNSGKNKSFLKNLKLNLKELQNTQENPQKEEILPSEKKENKAEIIENNNNLNFKKQKEEDKKEGINEEMKENLLEKLKNFRKVYEKLSKK